MPLQSTFGAMSARAWGRGGLYRKPPIVNQYDPGAAGVITSNAAGYSFTNWEGNVDGNHNGYLNRGLTTGLWYWEWLVQSLSSGGNAEIGLKSTTAQATCDTEYNTFNGGGGFATGVVPGGWAGSGGGGLAGALPAPGDVIGFALDLTSVARTFKIYKNNVLVATLTWTQVGLTLYPAVRWPNGNPGKSAGQLRLGRNNCTYSKAGYAFL